MTWDLSTVPEKVQKLASYEQARWIEAANAAIEHGYAEAQAQAIGYAQVNRLDGVAIMDYPAWRPGTYTAAIGGEFEVTVDDLHQMAGAINRLYALGHPVTLIDGHGSPTALGTMPAARVDGDVLRVACVSEWMTAAGIKEGAFGLSVEAMKDYASEAYTDGETYRYWPTAWAVLPAGEQPAVPPGEPLAATEPEQKPVRLYAQETAPEGGASSTERGHDMSTELEARIEKLEAAQVESTEKITALENERNELKAKLEAAEQERDELKSAKEADELAAAEAAVTERAATIMAAEARPGVREKMQARLEAAEGTEAKTALLDAWEPLLGENEIAQAKLHASEAKPEGDSIDALEDKAVKLAASEGIRYDQALERIIRKAGE